MKQPIGAKPSDTGLDHRGLNTLDLFVILHSHEKTALF